jgi:replicative DNA helicase
LIYNEEYVRKVLPFIRPDYFSDNTEKIVFKEIFEFINQYKNPPTHEALVINFTEKKNITEPQLQEAIELLNKVHSDKDEPTETQWLIEQTEKFCQDKAIYNAIMESVSILDSKSEKRTKGEIPQLLSDALGVSFDNNIGHDYLQNYEERYEFYHRKEDKIEFDLEYFNKITKGGLPNKTLNIILAGTGVGKSLALCHFSSSALIQGKNVLYITLEMAEEKIAERIDANLLNVPIQQLVDLSKSSFTNKVNSIAKKTQGTLIIKEYPTASAHSGHFKALLNELALKKSFRPDIIFIDYLNICASSRHKANGSVNSYSYIKSIAEELRGLAVEFRVPIVSATQTTRSGFGSSDPELTDTSESFGLPATADLMFALISTEELEGLGQIMVKQLKNRYSSTDIYKRFVLGIDRAKMRLYDVEQSAQKDILDSGKDDEFAYSDEPKIKKSFEGFKF